VRWVGRSEDAKKTKIKLLTARVKMQWPIAFATLRTVAFAVCKS
jgi:hypothetical protein